MYRVTIDRDACEGVFACLVRDDRFVEDADGLATVDPSDDGDAGDDDGAVDPSDGDRVVATYTDDRRRAAERAAAACPFDAIDVEEVR